MSTNKVAIVMKSHSRASEQDVLELVQICIGHYIPEPAKASKVFKIWITVEEQSAVPA